MDRGSIILFLSAVVGMTGPVVAETTQATMAVSLTVEAGCAIDAAPLAFGTIGGESVAETGAGAARASLRLRCTPGTPYAVALDGGRTGERRMTDASGTAFAPYEIFQDAGARRRWGAAPDTGISGIAPSSGAITLTAHGRLLTPASLPNARFSDVVTVTVAF